MTTTARPRVDRQKSDHRVTPVTTTSRVEQVRLTDRDVLVFATKTKMLQCLVTSPGWNNGKYDVRRSGGNGDVLANPVR